MCVYIYIYAVHVIIYHPSVQKRSLAIFAETPPSIGGERFTNHFQLDVGVSKNRGTSKWMVKIMEDPIKMDDLGGFNPLFSVAHPCSHKNVLLETVQKRC